MDTAENGWDGLTKLEHADYDVVLLDYMMPGITGLTGLQHIQGRHPPVPGVMMTAHASSQVAARPSRLGRGSAWSNPWTVRSCTRPSSAVLDRMTRRCVRSDEGEKTFAEILRYLPTEQL